MSPVRSSALHPYIEHDMMFTVEDITLGDGAVAFALANNLILPRDRESLEGINTLTMGILSFGCLIAVSLSFISFICISPSFF